MEAATERVGTRVDLDCSSNGRNIDSSTFMDT